MFRKVKIFQSDQKIVDGVKVDLKPTLYYAPYANVTDLYGKEKYEAMEKKLENTIVFEVRNCKKIRDMRKQMKRFYVKYEEQEYEIYDMNFKSRNDDWLLLKANGIT